MVGCVIVHNGKVIGEGYHHVYGGSHAEVNAIHSVQDPSVLYQSTMYVSLEPCTHFGKTPPCADLIVKHQLQRVVICNEDPNPLVAGRGIERMQKAGIHVESGLLKDQGQELNSRFFTSHLHHRPYIILKWAQTADGFIARENYDSKWISNSYSRQLVHKWRSEEDAIMVGFHTAHYDNPQLTVRDWVGRDPVRIFIDKQLSVALSSHLLDGSVKTLCFTERREKPTTTVNYIHLPEVNASQMVAELHKLGIQSVLIEGGRRLLQSFIDMELWDEARVFVGDQSFDAGISAPLLHGEKQSETKIFEDRLTIYKNSKWQKNYKS